uniref:Uncharacterized protein n=1 Tax=Acrobeloides nanus TaxID=290746 RepID=A0A914C4M5_9BILA
MAETKNDDDIHVDEFEDQQNFVPPAQKSVKEILNADANDESLKKYKEKLLGSASKVDVIVVEPSNPLNVIVKSISLVVDNKVMRSMNLPNNDEFTLAIKEGCHYSIHLEFYVQREIVTGLKYLHKVSRLGITIAKESYMLGSYAPNSELYVYKTPPEEAPSGMMQRGKYKVRSLITDDDKNRWLEWTWHLEICKDW